MTELPVDIVFDGFFWNWVVPGAVFALAAFATWALYRHFASKADD